MEADELMTYPVDLLHSFLAHARRQDGVLRSHVCIVAVGLLHGWRGLHSCHVDVVVGCPISVFLFYPAFAPGESRKARD